MILSPLLSLGYLWSHPAPEKGVVAVQTVPSSWQASNPLRDVPGAMGRVSEQRNGVYLAVDHQVAAFATASGTLRWTTTPVPKAELDLPAVSGDVPDVLLVWYILGGDSGLAALDRRDGRLLWKKGVKVRRAAVYALRGKLIASEWPDDLVALDLGSGEESGRWRETEDAAGFLTAFPEFRDVPLGFGNAAFLNGVRLRFDKSAYGTPNKVIPWQGAYLASYAYEDFAMDLGHLAGLCATLRLVPDGKGGWRDEWCGLVFGYYKKFEGSSGYMELVGTDKDGVYMTRVDVHKDQRFTHVFYLSSVGKVPEIVATDIDDALPPAVIPQGLVTLRRKGGVLVLRDREGHEKVLAKGLPLEGVNYRALPSGVLAVSEATVKLIKYGD